MLAWWTWRDRTFSVLDFITDAAGRGDPQRFAYTGAFLIATWGFWILIDKGLMTEWYFGGYVGGFVIGEAWTAGRRGRDRGGRWDRDDDGSDGGRRWER